MSSTTTDQINGFSGSTALKQPVRLATTAPVTLEGLAAIDGVVPAEGDRVLVKDQADARQNGIYVASSGDWQRAADFDGTGKGVRGTMVLVNAGTQTGLWIVTSADPVIFEVSNLSFTIVTLLLSLASGIAFLPAGNISATDVQAAIQELDTEKVAKAGDTMSGNLTISKNTPEIYLQKTATSQQNNIFGRLNGLNRWAITLGSNDGESGANAGSDLVFHRYNDVGAYIGSVLRARRGVDSILLPMGQLAFPATQNPSSDANTLDDYEEGTWTPALTFGGAAVGMTATAQTLGRYTKIGNMVAVYFRHQLSAKGSSTGTAVIGGLPFTSNNFSGGPQYSIATGQIDAATFASLVAGFDMAIGPGGTSISLRNRSTTGQSGAMSEANFTNSSGFGGSGVYMV